jgi:hypothetical protein
VDARETGFALVQRGTEDQRLNTSARFQDGHGVVWLYSQGITNSVNLRQVEIRTETKPTGNCISKNAICICSASFASFPLYSCFPVPRLSKKRTKLIVCLFLSPHEISTERPMKIEIVYDPSRPLPLASRVAPALGTNGTQVAKYVFYLYSPSKY